MTSWGDLPAELWLRVLGRLPLEDLCRTQRACKRLRDLVNDSQSLWRALYDATFGAAATGGGEPQSSQAGGGKGQAGRGGRNAGRGEQEGRRQQPCSSSSGVPAAATTAASLDALPAAKRRRSEPARPACSSGSPAGSAPGQPAAALPALAADGAATDWRALFKSRCGGRLSTTPGASPPRRCSGAPPGTPHIAAAYRAGLRRRRGARGAYGRPGG